MNLFNIVMLTLKSLVRKLETFKNIFIIIINRMGQSHTYSKKAKWDFHRQIMRSWAELVETEQSYLVEVGLCFSVFLCKYNTKNIFCFDHFLNT